MRPAATHMTSDAQNIASVVATRLNAHCVPQPWVKTHGYHHGVATRRGPLSTPYIPFVELDPVALEEFAIFLLEAFRAVMLALPLDVFSHRRDVRPAHRKGA